MIHITYVRTCSCTHARARSQAGMDVCTYMYVLYICITMYVCMSEYKDVGRMDAREHGLNM
jgi:hypothetical protein